MGQTGRFIKIEKAGFKERGTSESETPQIHVCDECGESGFFR
jgi:hypothetical protein